MSAMAIAPSVRMTARPARRPAGRPAAPQREVRDAASTSTLRLTRRGRAVVWALAAALTMAVGGAGASAWADGPSAALQVREVVVAPGDTLWGIAAGAAAPGEDVRDVVLELMALNSLSSGGLQAGQTVVVPVD